MPFKRFNNFSWLTSYTTFLNELLNEVILLCVKGCNLVDAVIKPVVMHEALWSLLL